LSKTAAPAHVWPHPFKVWPHPLSRAAPAC
jgi:hypothetical protein